jgi:tetratricopeptide (TPR) repeat protein
VLYGPSGAGKTSLVAAGVAPALERAGFQVLPVARVGAMLPPGVDLSRVRNVHSLGVLMHWYAGEPTLEALAAQSVESFVHAERVSDGDGERPLVLIVDQLEDLFGAAQWDQREGFLRDLAAALRPERGRTGPERPVRLLLVIDEAKLGELERHAAVLPDLMRVRYHLDRLAIPAAVEAIVGPAKTAITRVDAETLARDLAQRRVWVGGKRKLVAGEFVEPMHIQLACEEMWRRGRPGPLARTFDPDEALARFYDAALRRARGSERKIRRWFAEQLQDPDGARVAALQGKRSTAGLDNKVVERLEAQHLLRSEARLGARWFELAHDRLLAPIRRSNAAWFAARARARRVWRMLALFLLLLAAAAALAYLADLGWKRWQALQGEKLALEQERATLVESRDRLAGQLAASAGELAVAALAPRPGQLRAEIDALMIDLRVVQMVLAETARFHPNLRDVDIEAEILANFVAVGGELAGLEARVEQATAAQQALASELEAAKAQYPQPELAPQLTALVEASEGPTAALGRARKAMETARADMTRHSARLAAELEGWEAPPRDGAPLMARVREQARVFWREGLRALLLGDRETARARFERSQERDIGSAAGPDMLARMAWSEGKVDGAEQLLRDALTRDGSYGPALASMGQLYAHKGAPGDAVRCLRRALAVQPSIGLAHLVMRALDERASVTGERRPKAAADNPCGPPAASAQAPSETPAASGTPAE